MSSQKPSYQLADFESECASSNPRVTVSYDAAQLAKNRFNFRTPKLLISFIGNGGLRGCVFKNTAVQIKQLAGNQGKMIDAYHFKYGRSVIYIAFAYNDKKINWHIKSIKDDTETASIRLKKLLGVK